MDALDIAHPALTLMLVVSLLVVLGLLQNVNRRLRVAEHRVDSLEREQRLYDEALETLGTPAPRVDRAAPLREQIAEIRKQETP